MIYNLAENTIKRQNELITISRNINTQSTEEMYTQIYIH